MHFHFENLGLLDQVELELADLTLICGENNTGKTYATYAVYGFLRSWRQILHFLLDDEIDELLKDASQYRIDLEQMFHGKVDGYLKRMGKAYVGGLPRAFATDSNVFEHTVCVPRTCRATDFHSQAYQRTVQAGPSGKVLATLKKEAGSAMLDVLVADPEVLQRPFGGLTNFIADAIADIVFAQHLPRVHIASAERTGAAIFRKELDMARTRMLKAINQIDSKELKRNPFKILQEIDADYAWPVEDNVDFVRQLEDIDKRTGELAKSNPELLEAFDAIIGGTYKVVKQQLVFQAKGAGKQRFTMNEASSCIRALLDVGFYMRCRARTGDLFIIDEPELNLHPKNQRAFARLVARMVNAGIKVFITTHSDYLVKELNTLIMLNQRTEHTRAVQQQHGYSDAELLDPIKVRLYMTVVATKPATSAGRRSKIRTLKLATIYPDRGIEVETFDDTIEVMNAIQGEILYGGEL
ncbi:AAA family ATPase [Burkholderia vietnamiensis]|uniref:AAA family ATPase n=1 Tax=Burkholderia vietnamiensis TaxID=60552 RepID=A0ABS1ARP0_BURVI|nr:AAA family ATPase [Burkholderia vietnamiensis]MBJ9686775.1 AAA family ATPase [Burkholderia vietnamiensis]